MDGSLTDQQVVHLVAFALAHPDQDVIAVALQALASTTTPLADLPWHMLPAHIPEVMAMVQTLARFHAQGRGDVAEHLLFHHEVGWGRAAAAMALGNAGDPQAFEALTRALMDPDANVRSSAELAIAQLSDATPHTHLRVEPPPASPIVGAIAGIILGAPELVTDLRVVIRLLSHRHAAIRQGARALLNRISAPDHEAALSVIAEMQCPLTDVTLDFLGSLSDPRALEEVRRSGRSAPAIAALRSMRSIGALELLVAWLVEGSSWPNDKALLRDAIEAWGPAAARVLIRAFTTHESSRVRNIALLGRLGGPDALQALMEALHDPDSSVSSGACEGLRDFGSAAVDPLLELLTSGQPTERERAASVLGHIGDLKALPALIALASARDAPGQRAAIEALGGFSEGQSLAALASALGDGDTGMRRCAVRALSRRSGSDAVPLLALALQDRDWTIRMEALAALGAVWGAGAPAAARAILIGLADEHFRVARAAHAALACHSELALSAIDEAIEQARGADLRRLRESRERVEHALHAQREPIQGFAAAFPANVDWLASEVKDALGGVSPQSPGLRDAAAVTDDVQFSVIAPSVIARGASFVLEVWVYLEFHREHVLALARLSQGTHHVRIQSKGPVPVARATRLTIRVELPDAVLMAAEDTLDWEGQAANATFGVTIPANTASTTLLGRVLVFASGLKIARLDFVLALGATSTSVDDVTKCERRLKSAFASYASEDRDEVLGRIQGIRKIIPDLDVFLDVASLRSGERWEERLMEEIESRDTFYLFWSAPATRSTWVEREWRTALAERGLDFIDPIPLESPARVPPPPELSRLHFGDWTLAFRTRD